MPSGTPGSAVSCASAGTGHGCGSKSLTSIRRCPKPPKLERRLHTGPRAAPGRCPGRRVGRRARRRGQAGVVRDRRAGRHARRRAPDGPRASGDLHHRHLCVAGLRMTRPTAKPTSSAAVEHPSSLLPLSAPPSADHDVLRTPPLIRFPRGVGGASSMTTTRETPCPQPLLSHRPTTPRSATWLPTNSVGSLSSPTSETEQGLSVAASEVESGPSSTPTH